MYARKYHCLSLHLPPTILNTYFGHKFPVNGLRGSLTTINSNKEFLGRRNEPFTQFHAPHFRLSLIALPRETNTRSAS